MRTLRIVSSQNRSGRSQDTLHWVWLWVWVWSLALCRVAGECPKVCECKWKDGKQTVACIGAEFIDIPRRLDPSTQVLDLMQNNLKILPEHAFANTGLVNLQKLWLTYCNLQQLDRGAFKMLANLVELDLSHNLLRKVPSAALGDISGLRELRMARNALTSILDGAFTPTPDLVRLDVSSNRIYALNHNAFRGLASLEVLKISGNMLVQMSYEVLMPLMALHGLHLNDNPWHCDCRLRPLREWMINNNIAGLVPPLCARPRRLRGRSWHTLTLDEFVCVPHVTAISSKILAAHGDNVSLACRVETDLKADVIWLLGDRPLANTSEAYRYKVLDLVSINHSALLSNLTISGAVPKDQGTYRCIAENKAGRAESNLTLQVADEETEIDFFFFLDTTYIAGGLLSGLGFLIGMLLLVSCVVHRRQRVRLFRRQEEERGRAALTPQANMHCHPKPPREEQQRKESNFEVAASEKAPLQPSHPKHTHSSLDPVDGSYSRSSHARYNENNIDDMRGLNRLSPNNTDRISYVDMPIRDLSRSRSDLEERLSWKNLEFETDILRRECSPTGSVVSVVSNGPYTNMVDMPYPHTGDEYRREFQAYDSFSNRTRKTSHRSYEEDTRMGQSYDRNSLDGRCYSDQNLALSEESYDALSRRIGRRRAIRYPSLPTTPIVGHDETSRITNAQDARRLRRFMASHRGKYHSLEGTSELSGGDPYRHHFHAARLDKFLQEYRGLQAQIYRRKAAANRPGSTARLSASDTLDVTGSSHYKDTAVPPHREHDLGLSHRRALPTAKSLLSASQGVGMNKGSVRCGSERRRSMVQVGNLTHSDSVIEAMQGRNLTPTDYMIEVMQNRDMGPTSKSLMDHVTTRELDESETMREVREAMQERNLSPTDSVIDAMKERLLRSSESLPAIQRRKRSSTDSRMDSSSEDPPRQAEPLRSILKNRYEGGGLLYSGVQYPQNAYYDNAGVCEDNIDTSYSSEYKDYLDHES